jgi:hypothetical protein
MEKSIKLFVLAAVCSLFIVSGCARNAGGIAPSTTPINGRAYDIIGPAEGSDVRVTLLGILPVSDGNDTREAVANAIKSSGGDALINVTVENVSRYWILWATNQTQVFGDAIKFKEAKPAIKEEPTPVEVNEPEEVQ